MVKTAATSFISAILGGLLVFFAMTAVQPTQTQQQPDNRSIERTETTQPNAGLSAVEIYRRFGPGVVNIQAVFTTERTDFFGFRTQQQQQATGSGFIIDKSGVIVTNAHVVRGTNATADKITVVLSNEEEVEAKLLGTDLSTDIAVLKIDPGKRNLKVLTLGDSSNLKVGDTVYAIGSPFGLEGSMTEGIISALDRTIDSPNGQFRIRGAVQTDAAVNPGNSGGPLINTAGEVVGINAQIESRSGSFAGVAFAIPSNTAKRIAEQIRTKGRASHAWLGITGLEITADIAKLVKSPVNNGVMIVRVIPGASAEKAGFKGATSSVVDEQTGQQLPTGGDIIVKINNTTIKNMDEIIDAVDEHKVGDKLSVEVYRGERKQTVQVTLTERPQTLTE